MATVPSTFRVIGYAAFLACSWTWCIGMYLPVILMRDFGPWSFLVFALPNCVGAAAMGVFLWRPGASERFLAGHFHACRLFSLVTVWFQVWFLATLAIHFGWRNLFIPSAILAGIGFAVLAFQRGVWRTVGSLACFAASLGLAAWYLTSHVEVPSGGEAMPRLGMVHLAALAPVCAFGFALCPYLDFTFHAARQSLPGRAGSRAFLIGFLVLFPCMLAFTWLYAGPSIRQIAVAPWSVLAIPVVIHIILQTAFTAGVHGASLKATTARGSGGAGLAAIGILGVPGVAVALAVRFAAPFEYSGLDLFEITYRLFMAFYGLVFPAYVLICAVGANGFRGRPTTGTLIIFALAVIAAAPFCWMGFIERQTPYLAAGVAIPILARALVKRPTPQAPHER